MSDPDIALPNIDLLPREAYVHARRETLQIIRGGVHLEGADLTEAHLEGADLIGAHLEGAILHGAHLQGALLPFAHLDGAQFAWADLHSASLGRAQLAGADFRRVQAQGANFSEAFCDAVTNFYLPTLSDARGGVARFWAIYWGNARLENIDWSQLHPLAEERIAHQGREDTGERKARPTRDHELLEAVQANQELATALREQDLHEEADYFAYRGLMLQRALHRRQRHYARYLGSGLLDLMAGYGYRPLRAFIAYLLVILAFAALFLLNAPVLPPQLTWDQALVLSISSFHGRGFFPSGLSLSDTLARLAAGEAMIGLLIEITFIATFTQRFFAR
jgi:Pentapeptide repeats (8 copies)